MSVYFIQAGEGGRIKIGYSPVPERRITYLQRFSGPNLIVLAIVEGNRGLEYALQRHLRAHRAHDEWFEPTPEVLTLIERAKSLPQDRGERQEFVRAMFTGAELDRFARAGGLIAESVVKVRRDGLSYDAATLAALIRLLPTDDGVP